jgi:hypothetical protein
MKTIFDIFDNSLSNIHTAIESGNLQNGSYIATELIQTSELMDFNDGVFISEILESSINQLLSESSSYDIPKEEKITVISSLLTEIDNIKKCYKKEDKNELFFALERFRNVVTKFQYHARRTYKSSEKRFDPLEILRR